jgi:hypothetical protein
MFLIGIQAPFFLRMTTFSFYDVNLKIGTDRDLIPQILGSNCLYSRIYDGGGSCFLTFERHRKEKRE